MPTLDPAEAASAGARPEPLARTLAADEYDVFLSYSRRDATFAAALQRQLPRYLPPRSVAAPRRALRVFRDVDDIVGTVLEDSIRRHLDRSARVIVVCSPAARASRYVNAEIRHFAQAHGPHRIIPVLVDGVPNGEAADEADRAFPAALLEAAGSDPLAVDFRGLDPAKERMARGRFRPAWFQLLANVYGISQRELEARERARTRRRIATAAAFALLVALAAGAWTAYSRSDGYQVRRVLADAPGVISQAGDTTAAAWLDALLAAGRHDDALTIARSIEDPNGRSRALSALAPRLAAAGGRDAALEAASGALAAGERAQVAQDRARALAEASAVLAALGQADSAARAAERAVAAALAPFTPPDAADGRDNVLREVAVTLAGAGQARAALAAVNAIQDLNDPVRFPALGEVAAGLARAGRRPEALRIAGEMLDSAGTDPWARHTASIALARAGDVPRALATARGIQAPDVRAYALGDVAAALAEARDARAAQVAGEAVAAARSIPDAAARARSLASVAPGLAEAGVAREAVRAARDGLAAIRQLLPAGRPVRGDFPLDDPLAAIAEVLADAGQAEDALAAARLIGGSIDRYAVLESAAAALVRTGQPAGAVDAIRAMNVPAWRSERVDAFSRLAARLAASGHPAAAAEAAREGLATARQIEHAYQRVTALAGVVEAMRAAGQGPAAAQVAREALAIARAQDDTVFRATALREAAVALLATAPGDAAGAVREAAAAARDAGSGAANELGWLAAALVKAGQADVAARMTRQALDLSRTIEPTAYRIEVLDSIASALAQAGAGESAAGVALAADSVALRLTDAAERSAALARMATAYARAGWLWRARQVADRDGVLPDDRLRVYTAILIRRNPDP